MKYLRETQKAKILKKNNSIYYGETKDNQMDGKGMWRVMQEFFLRTKVEFSKGHLLATKNLSKDTKSIPRGIFTLDNSSATKSTGMVSTFGLNNR